MAAAAALKRKHTESAEEEDEGGSADSQPKPPAGGPMNIAAMAAAAARKKEEQYEAKNMAAMAAAASRTSEEEQQSASSSSTSGMPVNIAAMAAAAARKKEEGNASQQSRSRIKEAPSDEGEEEEEEEMIPIPDDVVQTRPAGGLLNIAAMAAAAARKKAGIPDPIDEDEEDDDFSVEVIDEAPSLEESQSAARPMPPMGGIAAMAAAAARKKEQDQQSSTEAEAPASSISPPADGPVGSRQTDQQQLRTSLKSQLPPPSSKKVRICNSAIQQKQRQPKSQSPDDYANLKWQTPDDYMGVTWSYTSDDMDVSFNDNSDGRQPTRRKLGFNDVEDDNDVNDNPTSEADDVHAKAAEALVRVIKAKDLDLDHVLSKLDRYKRETSRLNSRNYSSSSSILRSAENRRQNIHSTMGVMAMRNNPIDLDEYASDDNSDSEMSTVSTISANHRRIASNSEKLAQYIMLSPADKFSSRGMTNVPIKDDPEFSLYFRMLRYGFTIGAVRAALQRDGKPDITRLDPDKPVHLQKVPKVVQNGLGRENSRMSSATSSSSIEIAGLEFSENGLTDRGWESALESARKTIPRDQQQRSPSRKTPNYRKNALTPGASFSIGGKSDRSGGDHNNISVPPWLQSNVERGVVEGWLRKRTKRGRWVRRWYLLDSTGLYYAHSPPSAARADGKFVKIIDARLLGARKSQANPKEFDLWHPSRNGPICTLRAQSDFEAQQWIDALRSTCERQRLVDEVVVGSTVPENLVQNNAGKIEELEKNVYMDDPFRTPRKLGTIMAGGSTDDYDDSSDEGGVISREAIDKFKTLLREGKTGGSGPSFSVKDIYLDNKPRRPKLKRQSSWPPLSLLSDGTLGVSDLVEMSAAMANEPPMRSMEEIEADIKKLEAESKALDEGGSVLDKGKSLADINAKLDNLDKEKKTLEESSHNVGPSNGGKGEGGGTGTGSGSGGGGGTGSGDGGGGGGESKGDNNEPRLDADGEPKLKFDPKYEKYYKMMKLGLHKDVAKHALTRDQLDPSILDLDPEKSLKSQRKEDSVNKGEDPPLKDDPKFAKYFKMMKMGLPKEVAQHAMTRDQVDPTILDLDPDKSLNSQRKPEGAEGNDDGPPLKEDPEYVKYFKMMKMGLPKEAAKHAMARDQKDPSVLDLDPEKSLKSQRKPEGAGGKDDGPPLKEDPKYVKYFKMLKMGLPMGAVKNALTRDGLDPAIMDLDPEKSVKSQTESKDDGPPLKDDPKYVKYFKMLKMGLPMGAVKNALTRDGLDPAIMDLDPEKSVKSQTESKDDGPPLKDDPKYSKYFKMLKMGLPMGAVKNALTRDGLDPAIMDLNHDKSVASQLDPKKKGAKKLNIPKKPKIRRKKVYWTKVDAQEGTVWAKLKEKPFLDVKLKCDIEEFERLFTQSLDAAKKQVKKDDGAAAKPAQGVKVIDSKRGMNGDIILRKVKLSPEEVASMIDNMDRGSLGAVELKSLFEFMPNDEEIKGLTNYLASSKSKDEALASMIPCEQYMVAMKDLKDSEKKFQSIIFLAEFESKMKELKWDVDHLDHACHELKSSKRFQTLLKLILDLVNKINLGDDLDKAVSGFTLDSLPKLSETKAFDNKTSVLQYLVKVVRKSNKDIVKFREDIKSVVLAKGVVMERLLTAAKQLCEDSRVVTETAKKDGDDYRASLKNPEKSKKARHMKAQRASVKELRKMVTFLSEKDVPIGQNDFTHFERFALFSKLELQKALGTIKEANQQYIGVLEFFGEDMKTQASDFFAMIDGFMEAFDQALDAVEKEEELKMKELRRQLAKEAKLKVKSAFKAAASADDALNEADEEEKPKGKKWPTVGGKKDRPILLNKGEDEPSKDDEESKPPDKPMNIAAMAAMAAKKKKVKQDPDTDPNPEEDNGTPMSGGIAALAATAAAKKKDKPSSDKTETDAKEPRPLAVAPVNIAAMAAEAARENSSKSSADASSRAPAPPPAASPMNIAAMAAAAARKKEESGKSSAEEPPKASGAPGPPPVMNIAAMAAAAARKKEETSSKPEQEKGDVPVQRNMNIAAMAAAAAREKEQKNQPEPQKEVTTAAPATNVTPIQPVARPAPGLANIAAMAAAAAAKRNEAREREEAKRMEEEKAKRKRELEEQKRKEEEAQRLAEENAKRERELAAQKENDEMKKLRAQTMNIAAMAAAAAAKKSEARERLAAEEAEKAKRDKEAAEKQAAEDADRLKHEEYERERQAAEELERARREKAEKQRREMELEEKERLKREHHDKHLMEEKRLREKLLADKQSAAKRLADEKARKEKEEKLRIKREERARLLREEREREEKRLAEKRARKLERKKKEEEMRARYEAEKKAREEAARMEFERERLEREKAKREALEQQRRLLEEQQRIKRAQRLQRIKAEQEKMEMQVKKIHPGLARPTNEAVEQVKMERRQRLAMEANHTSTSSQRQKAEALRLVAEADRLKKRMAAEKSAPGNDVEAELLNWVSKKHLATAKSGKPKAVAKSSSATGGKSRLSMAVAAAAQKKSSAPPPKPTGVDNTEMEIMNWMQSKKQPSARPAKPTSAPVDDTEMELLNWVKKKKGAK